MRAPWGVLQARSAEAVEMLCAVEYRSDILFPSCLKSDWRLSLSCAGMECVCPRPPPPPARHFSSSSHQSREDELLAAGIL